MGSRPGPSWKGSAAPGGFGLKGGGTFGVVPMAREMGIVSP